MSVLDEVSALAFHRGNPLQANTLIDEARALRAGGEGISYEIALPALGPEEFLLNRALPKLVYFLDCRGIHPPASGDVFVTLFSSTGLLCVDAGPLVELLARARGFTLAELIRRYGEGGSGDPLLLSSSS